MESIAVMPVATSQRHRRSILLVLALAVALVGAALGPASTGAAPAAGSPTSSTADNASQLKMVIIVGPTHSSTSNYLSRGESLAKAGEARGMDVRRVFHPKATAARVLANAQGANIIAYFGHGNGWPSPYAPFQEKTKNGFGLNPVEGGSASNVAYHGGNWIRANITLAPNAVAIFGGLCYASGNAEQGMAIPSWNVARERTDNYAAAFLAVGAKAVFAYGWQSPNSIVDMLHTTNKTMDEIFMTKGAGTSPSSGFLGWDNRRLDSTRAPGMKNHLDPHSKEGFLRALSGDLQMTASDWSGVEPVGGDTPTPPPAEGPTVPTGLAATTDSTGAVHLSWNPATSTILGTMRYRVFRNGSAIGTKQTARTYTDKPKSGTHSYQVRAIDAAGNLSSLSTPPVSISVTVPTATPSATPTATPSPTAAPTATPTATPTASPSAAPVITPSTPQGLTGTPQNERKVQLSWQPVTASSGTLRYRVFRNGNAIGTRQLGTTYLDQPAAEGSYKYQVRWFHSSGIYGALSAPITVQVVNAVGGSSNVGTVDKTPPSVPTGLKATPLGYRRIQLSWQPSTDDRAGAIRYRVFRNGRRVTTTTNTSFVDRPTVAGTHRYTFRAIDAAGNYSGFSAAINGQAIKGAV